MPPADAGRLRGHGARAVRDRPGPRQRPWAVGYSPQCFQEGVMGGPGLGSQEPNEKYVMLVEVDGPTNPDVAQRFNAELGELLTRYQGKVRYATRSRK